MPPLSRKDTRQMAWASCAIFLSSRHFSVVLCLSVVRELPQSTKSRLAGKSIPSTRFASMHRRLPCLGHQTSCHGVAVLVAGAENSHAIALLPPTGSRFSFFFGLVRFFRAAATSPTCHDAPAAGRQPQSPKKDATTAPRRLKLDKPCACRTTTMMTRFNASCSVLRAFFRFGTGQALLQEDPRIQIR